MGDRTSCRLSVAGIIEEKDVVRLAEAIDLAYGGQVDDLVEVINEGLEDLEFEGVNYANLDGGLEALLRELRLSYAWEWDQGDEYSPGVQLYDARTGETSGELSRLGQDLVLTVQEAKDAARVAASQRWEDFWHDSWELVIVRSNHEMMELAAAGKLPEGYLERRQVADEKESG